MVQILAFFAGMLVNTKIKSCKNFNELLKVKMILLFQDQGIHLSGSLSSASSAA